MDIASMLEVEVQEVADSKENVTPSRKAQKFPCQSFSKEENDFYKLTYGSDVASVRFLRLHCTGCDEHIGSAPAEAHNMHEHPVLRTLLCAKCREFYGDGTFEQGDDATDMFCRWCANGGNLYCCSYCSNTFCSKCIKRNFDPPTIKRIEAEDSWKCFVCDPKDLFPLRSICRALITHIETVTRLLENDRRMSPKEIEEKMHLDETKCCSRKRKRRRRRTLSNSDDDNEDEDVSYVPELERPDSPPAKKRKVRSTGRTNSSFSNGYYDHEYYEGSRRQPKAEPDLDPADLMMSCEQTMIEGDTEIINPNEVDESASPEKVTEKENVNSSPAPIPKASNPPKLVQISPQVKAQFQQKQQIHKLNNMAINPVPLANLLKVALSSGAKKIKLTHAPNKKLVAVPMSVMPKSIAGSSSITFVKPPTHFLVPKNMTAQKQPVSAIQPRPTTQQPSVIDIDSDDEPVIVEKNLRVNSGIEIIDSNNANIVNEIDIIEENIVPEEIQVDGNASDVDCEPILMSETATTKSNSRTRASLNEPPMIAIDGQISLKTRQRDQRFKKMLQLQSQEIDNTWSELKTKIMKLIQLSNMKAQQEGDPLSSAGLCTKRFHRALRKALVDLSHINDRVVKDYIDWKKKRAKTEKEGDKPPESTADDEEKNENPSKNKTKNEDGLTLEMICERDSASESEDEDDVEIVRENEDRIMEATDVPPEFAQILDHLSIFKRKPTSVKAVGNSSVITEDKACQAYDVSWRDYEKCIGYSLLTKSDFNSETKEETLQPVAVPDENFGKYQEQFLFYLQHIEDFGIETDEFKGLPDPNHIPLKDLIDGTSPFIMDMLERLSPVTLSNGCASPSSLPPSSNTEKSDIQSTPTMIDSSTFSNENENRNSEPKTTSTTDLGETENNTSDENAAPTSKAVEELVKMVTKLSEDLRSESERKENEESLIEKETISAVNSILEVTGKKNVEVQQQLDNEIADICATTSNNDECTILE